LANRMDNNANNVGNESIPLEVDKDDSESLETDTDTSGSYETDPDTTESDEEVEESVLEEDEKYDGIPRAPEAIRKIKKATRQQKLKDDGSEVSSEDSSFIDMKTHAPQSILSSNSQIDLPSLRSDLQSEISCDSKPNMVISLFKDGGSLESLEFKASVNAEPSIERKLLVLPKPPVSRTSRDYTARPSVMDIAKQRMMNVLSKAADKGRANSGNGQRPANIESLMLAAASPPKPATPVPGPAIEVQYINRDKYSASHRR
jgi:hypothetical protein